MLRSRSAPAPDHKNRRQRGKPYTEDTERFCISNCLVIFSLCRGPPKYRLKPYQKKIITGYAVGTLRGLAGVFLVAACTNIHIQYSITVLIIIYIQYIYPSYTLLLHASIANHYQFISDLEVQEMK